MSSKIHASTFFSPLSSHPTYPTSTIFPLQNPSGNIVLFPQLKIFSSFLLLAKVNKYGASCFVHCSFGGYKHHTLGLQMEEPQMQWRTPTRFHGFATLR